jgi:predicted PurR-regulated permease PerM
MRADNSPISSRGGAVPLTLMALALIAVAAWFFHAVRAILPPFVLGAILAYVLNPVVSHFERRGYRRDSSVFMLYVFLALAFGFAVYWTFVVVWDELPLLRQNWPLYVRRCQTALKSAERHLLNDWPILKEVPAVRNLGRGFSRWGEEMMGHAPLVLTSAAAVALNVLLAPVIGFFFLRGGAQVVRAAVDVCPARWVERFLGLVEKIHTVFGSYLRGVLLEAVMVSLLTTLGLRLLGVDYSVLLGLAAGVLNMVPYLGITVAGCATVALTFFEFQTVQMPLQVAALFVGVHLVDGWILQPLIFGRTVRIGMVTLLFALMAGGKLAGLWGLVFAVPAAGLIKETLWIFYEWYRVERGFRPGSRELTAAAAKPWLV